MHNEIVAWTYGTKGLVSIYMLVLVPLLIVLWRARAPVSKLLVAPVTAVMGTIIAGIVTGLLSFLVDAVGVGAQSVLRGVINGAVYVAIGYLTGRLVMQQSGSDSRHQRGAVVRNRGLSGLRRSARSVGKDLGPCHPDTPITLAGLPIAADDETKHFKLIGTTGTGKSTAIREMLSGALARGDRAVIADPDGGYMRHFYNAARGDVILNPFYPDAVKWHLLDEIKNDYDVDQLARSLIPDVAGGDKIWTGYARTFFTALTQQVVAAGVSDDAELYRLLLTAPDDELRVLLAETAAGPLLQKCTDKMFGGVRAVTNSAVAALKYTIRQPGTPFSVRQWVRQGAAVKNGGPGGALFIPYSAGEIAAFGSVVSAWLRMAIFEAMDRPEGDQRLWFFIDELDALGVIDGLADGLPRLRKFGGRCGIGLQSISQVSGTFGHAAADTIVENCGNTLILRCSASEKGGTSQFASRLIGQREVIHLSRSRTRVPGQWSSSTTTSEQRSTEYAVMPSEIERLPNLEGFLKFASISDWMYVTLDYASYPVVWEKRAAGAVPAQGAQAAGPP
jgi:type IV secretory pathway TraG/TraD family ATPase VirD4